MATGYLGLFKVPEAGAVIPLITSVGNITFQVSERVDSQGFAPISKAVLAISNVDIGAGAVKSIIVESQRSVGGSWEEVASFDVNWTGDDNSGSFIIPGIAARPAGINHDFRVSFANGDGELGIGSDSGTPTSAGNGSLADTGASWPVDGFIGGEVITDVGTFSITDNTATGLTFTGDATGATTYEIRGPALVVSDTGVTFNGIDDMAEYFQVTGIDVTNASGDGQGGAPGSEQTIPTNGIAHLTWTDFKTLAAGNHDDMQGNSVALTEAQIASVERYAIWIFVSDAGLEPQNEYPTDSDSNGTWYFVDETINLEIDVPCPRAKEVAFAVGARTANTRTTTSTPTGRIPVGLM